MSKRFTITIEEDEHGDLFLPIPEELLEELRWELGDELDHEIDEDGVWILTKRLTE